MSSIQDELNILYSALRQQRIVLYADAAALTWVAYDILLTASQELKVIWRGKVSLAKFFYFIARYYPLAMLIMNMAVGTNTSDMSDTLAPTAVSYAVDALLIIRLYALYNKNRLLLGGLLILYFGCLVTVPDVIENSIAAWTISLFPQLKTFISHDLTMGNIAEEGSTRGTILHALRQTRKLSPLFSLFMRDGTFAFLVVFAVVLVNLIFAVAANKGPIEQMGTPCLLAADAVLASRLVLNLGGFLDSSPVVTNSGGTRDTHGRPTMSENLGTLQFADRQNCEGQMTVTTSMGEHGFVASEHREDTSS
ncbi:uncharacterized protein FOMMEDRAFT_30831 [Fomitiporia mediterranea MF3/22]|uniref:uncharacterized protein n=1 Tax=Fomitiporia mediterranea (strain MF3/22) TaxID=694068 RepID=UPI00044087F7|nr:uncharacterized protein FOMMEDRAFT_30831 [Fomitiporia mediterranea MF3/22]EJD00176.1 hypothetical protein FOMMEDRAFT_30831 [Fomitiporia mediterranea MF3/22]